MSSDDPAGTAARTGDEGARVDPRHAALALRRLVVAGEALRHAAAAHFSLTLSDTVAMSYLALEGSLTATELAQRTHLAPSSVTTVLDRLETAGFIQRQPSTRDRRKVEAIVTAKGREALAQSEAWMREALGTLPAADLEAVAVVMPRLADALLHQANAIAEQAGPGR